MSLAQFVHLHNHTQYSLLDGACRIDERSQDIEDRADAQFAARPDGMTHGRVEFYGEEEADAYLIDCLRHLYRRQIEIDAQRF